LLTEPFSFLCWDTKPVHHSRRTALKDHISGLRLLLRRCGELAEQHPGFQAASFTPHDFRRLLATDLVNSGLPIHIGAALLGHVNLQTTRGYVAVFNEDVVRHYQQFLDRRRQSRPSDEYRPVFDPEWLGFEQHFDQRKVELGGCARPYGTPCQHEHSCLRCPVLNINPKMLPRLDEIEDDLQARRGRAAREGWLGEVKASTSPSPSSAKNANRRGG
jgi:hypothetical protein